jgi:membrane glycosyltransferase
MLVRRFVFFAIAVATAGLMTLLMVRVLAPGGWTVLKALILLVFLGVVPWLGLCLANALAGLCAVALLRDPARAMLPVGGDIAAAPITARTALAVTVRNETMAQVLPPMQALLESLAGYGDRFRLCILSDTQNPVLAAAEEEAVRADPRIFYRRRTTNTGFKAGNVMAFFDEDAEGFDFAIMLDADSEMQADAVLQLVRIMQADPRMGIVQHLTVGRPAMAAFPRLFQFGMRAGMRIWAIGQAWWQGDEGPYWGHNAILRIAAFRAHARLDPLPDGSPILSHDQVEAARLRAAGWRVCVWAREEGSLEDNPPALPEFLHRDGRWLAGNLQYRHLLRLPGFRPMGRWQLVQAILLFLGAPLYTLLLILAALNAGDAVPRPRLLLLVAVWALVIYSPKMLGYGQILASARQRARYGGGGAFAAGAMLEIVFTLLLDAISQPSKSLTLIRVLAGRKSGWLPQNRTQRGVGWREAAGLFWPHTLLGLAVFALLWRASPFAALLALPFAGGLLVAVPFCVVTASPGFSAWLRRRRLAATPEELAPPSVR